MRLTSTLSPFTNAGIIEEAATVDILVVAATRKTGTANTIPVTATHLTRNRFQVGRDRRAAPLRLGETYRHVDATLRRHEPAALRGRPQVAPRHRSFRVRQR